MDTKIAQMNICDYISFLRNQKGLASQSVSAYVSAIRKFYVMNDVQLNWEKIHSFKGEEEKRADRVNNTPERGENGYTEAVDFVQSVCGVGTAALVDEDDGQKEGSFDRVIGLVYCGNDSINSKNH